MHILLLRKWVFRVSPQYRLVHTYGYQLVPTELWRAVRRCNGSIENFARMKDPL